MTEPRTDEAPAAPAELVPLVQVEAPAAPAELVPLVPVEAPAAPAELVPVEELVPDPATLVPLEELAPAIIAASTSRRAFLGFGLAVAGGLVGAAALARFIPIFGDDLDPASPIVKAYDPGTRQWTFIVDTAVCIGCGLCVVACKEENHVTEETAYTRTWVERRTVTTDGTLYVDSPDAGIDGFPSQSAAPGAAGKAVEASHFQPRLCMQCADSPCTLVCPVGATYTTDDGVILVDAGRCIGCAYCIVACPYGARYLVPAGEHGGGITPGIADKCNWCYHRINQGQLPACVEICPVGSRKFGDAADEDSEIAKILRERNPKMLYPEYGTNPRVLYLGPSVEEA